MAKKLTKKEVKQLEDNMARLTEAREKVPFKLNNMKRLTVPYGRSDDSEKFFYSIVFMYHPFFSPEVPNVDDATIYYKRVTLDFGVHGDFAPDLKGFALNWLPSITKILAEQQHNIRTTLEALMRQKVFYL